MRVITANQILDRLHHSDEVIAFILRITLMRYRHLLQQMRRAEESAAPADPTTEHVPTDHLAMPNSRDAVAKLELENELREGLDKGELRLHYQPLVALSGQGRLVGFEALLRWENPRWGLTPPKDFIPLAEETGLIVPMCRWALGAAGFRRLAPFQAAAPGRRLVVSVNITKHQIDDQETLDILDRILGEAASPRTAEARADRERADGRLRADARLDTDLKKRGLRISIDDFGTGYSSLGYLHRFPVDE